MLAKVPVQLQVKLHQVALLMMPESAAHLHLASLFAGAVHL